MLPQEQRRQQRQEYFHNVSPVFMTKSRTASVSFGLVVEIQALENQNQKTTPIQKLRFNILNQKKLSVLFRLFCVQKLMVLFLLCVLRQCYQTNYVHIRCGASFIFSLKAYLSLFFNKGIQFMFSEI